MDNLEGARARSVDVRATACRICAAGCGILVDVDVDSQEVLSVKGDPHDTITAGYTCTKGRAGPAFHRAPERLDVPLIRQGRDLVDATWDHVLDDIAAATHSIVTESGPNAVASYLGTGGPLDPAGFSAAGGFFRSLGTSQNYSALSVDCSGKHLIPQLVSGVQMLFQPDLDNANLLIAIGVNTVVSHGHGIMVANPLVRLREMRSRGARLVVIDPRVTETVRHADLHVAPRPGSDPALLSHVIRAVLADGADAAYLHSCAQPDSVERLRRAVAGFDRERTAAICDVPAEQLDVLVAMIRSAGRVAIETGTGTTMNRSGNVTEWLVWALAAVTGSLDRIGGATFNPGFFRPIEESLPSGRGDLGPRPVSRPDLPRIVNGEMPCAALVDEIEAGEVRALFVRNGNPALAFPDNARLRAALAKLDLLVVIDVRETETSRLATHVLPMTDHFERGDVITGYLQAKPFARWAPAVVAPVGQRRQQWWMFTELSKRMGLPMFGSPARHAALVERELDDETVASLMFGRAHRSWDEVRSAPFGIIDESIEPGWMIPDRLPHLLDLAPAEVVDDLAGLGLEAVPADGTLVLINRRLAGSYNSLKLTGDQDVLLINPDDAVARSLDDGDTAVVRTPTGSCTAVVQVTDKIRRGTVSLPHCVARSDVNQLTSTTDVDLRSSMPILSGFAVSVDALANASV